MILNKDEDNIENQCTNRQCFPSHSLSATYSSFTETDLNKSKQELENLEVLLPSDKSISPR